MTADLHLAAAAETLARLDEIGPDAYGANAPALIMEAQLRVAYAEAVTNRIRLVDDLIRSANQAQKRGHVQNLGNEFDALLRSITTPREETP